mmetsp:Transcript_68402/g.216393  ORF Transcript_68402/g.216393 Transcript_68402/m.216393 type:complete len:374 (+) Transcript_68402:71-1192(+)
MQTLRGCRASQCTAAKEGRGRGRGSAVTADVAETSLRRGLCTRCRLGGHLLLLLLRSLSGLPGPALVLLLPVPALTGWLVRLPAALARLLLPRCLASSRWGLGLSRTPAEAAAPHGGEEDDAARDGDGGEVVGQHPPPVTLTSLLGLLQLLKLVPHGPRLVRKCLCLCHVGGDDQVVKQDTLGHSPDVDAHGIDLGEDARRLVDKVVGVLDLARPPNALVRGVVYLHGVPLALVRRVANLWGFPLPAANLAHRVLDDGGLPLPVLVLVPVLGYLGRGVGDFGGLVLPPAGGHGCLGIGDHHGCVLVPVLRLGRRGVVHLGLVDPVGRLGVRRVVDLLWRVHRRLHGGQEAAGGLHLAVDRDFKGVVRADNQAV